MKELNEKIFDLKLEEAAKLYLEQIASEYPSAEEVQGKYTFSPEFENWAEQIIKSEDKRLKHIEQKRTWQKILKTGQKVSVVICGFVAALFMMAFTISPIRIALLNFVTTEHGSYIEVDLKSEDNNKEADRILSAINMSEEFTAINVVGSEAMTMVTYQNDIGESIQLERYAKTGDSILDSENSSFDKVMIRESDGFISIKNGKTTLLFHDSKYGYTLISDIDKNRLIKIAEAILIN